MGRWPIDKNPIWIFWCQKLTIHYSNSIKLFKKGIEIMEDSKIVLGSKLDLMFNNKSFKIKVLSIN